MQAVGLHLNLLVPLALLVLASIYDLRTREIPNWIALVILAWAVLATAMGWHQTQGPISPWLDFALGLVAATLVGGLLYGASLWLYKEEGLGAADLKLLIALGAVVGVGAIFALVILIALAGGILALIAKIRGQRTLAYVPAIALGLGVLTCATYGGLVHALSPWNQ